MAWYVLRQNNSRGKWDGPIVIEDTRRALPDACDVDEPGVGAAGALVLWTNNALTHTKVESLTVLPKRAA